MISTSNDSTIKIWDLRKGCIMYTLYGHEGPSTTAAWSPLGDYFVTGGADSVVLCWQSNLNAKKQEDLSEMQAKIETEVYVTQKERVDKLPDSRNTKIKKSKENKSKLANKGSKPETPLDNLDSVSVQKEETAAKKLVQGVTYRQLRPEVKMTLEKIVYQLELCAKSLQLMEMRVIDSEDKLQSVMNWIKTNDIDYVSPFIFLIHLYIATNYSQLSALDEPADRLWRQSKQAVWPTSPWRAQFDVHRSPQSAGKPSEPVCIVHGLPKNKFLPQHRLVCPKHEAAPEVPKPDRVELFNQCGPRARRQPTEHSHFESPIQQYEHAGPF